MSKKMKIIFTLSFLLNILVLGILLGGVYKIRSWHMPYAVSETTQETLKKNIQSSRTEMRADFQKMRGYKKELKDVIAAEKFDKDAFNDKVNQMLEVKNNISKRKVETLGNTLSELSQEDRKAFSKHVLGHLLEKHPKGRNDRKPMSKKENHE